MQKISRRITESVCRNCPETTEQQAATINYGLECILGESSKILIYFLIFRALSLTDHYLVAVFFFCILRIFAGGYHANSYVQCLLISFTILSTAILVGSQFYLSLTIRTVILIISLALIWIFAPVDHPNKPIISKVRHKNFKKLSVAVFVVLASITFLFNDSLATTAVFTMLLEGVSLPIGQMTKRSFTNEYSEN